VIRHATVPASDGKASGFMHSLILFLILLDTACITLSLPLSSLYSHHPSENLVLTLRYNNRSVLMFSSERLAYDIRYDRRV